MPVRAIVFFITSFSNGLYSVIKKPRALLAFLMDEKTSLEATSFTSSSSEKSSCDSTLTKSCSIRLKILLIFLPSLPPLKSSRAKSCSLDSASIPIAIPSASARLSLLFKKALLLNSPGVASLMPKPSNHEKSSESTAGFPWGCISIMLSPV